MLMNSFSTSADTLKALSKYPDLGTGDDLEFVQNKAPKVTKSDKTPATWEKDPGHEWCPPGHGDLYPAMLGSGTLDKLLSKGFKYMFVSNSDNLGATMDLKLLSYFVSSKAPFMMEVATRTEADKKGGHLARDKATGGLLLRESAQCPEEDEKAFQDVTKYKFTDAMEKLIPNGPPSLINCKKLVVEGPVTFAKGVIVKGTVTFKNSGASKEVTAGTYE